MFSQARQIEECIGTLPGNRRHCLITSIATELEKLAADLRSEVDRFR